MSIRSSWLMILFNCIISLIFCHRLLIIENEVEISNYECEFIYFSLQFCFCFMYLEVLLLST